MGRIGFFTSRSALRASPSAHLVDAKAQVADDRPQLLSTAAPRVEPGAAHRAAHAARRVRAHTHRRRRGVRQAASQHAEMRNGRREQLPARSGAATRRREPRGDEHCDLPRWLRIARRSACARESRQPAPRPCRDPQGRAQRQASSRGTHRCNGRAPTSGPAGGGPGSNPAGRTPPQDTPRRTKDTRDSTATRCLAKLRSQPKLHDHARHRKTFHG